MLEIIEKLLVLQDRDRQVIQHRDQLNRIGPERNALLGQAEGTKKALEEAGGDVATAAELFFGSFEDRLAALGWSE